MKGKQFTDRKAPMFVIPRKPASFVSYSNTPIGGLNAPSEKF